MVYSISLLHCIKRLGAEMETLKSTLLRPSTMPLKYEKIKMPEQKEAMRVVTPSSKVPCWL